MVLCEPYCWYNKQFQWMRSSDLEIISPGHAFHFNNDNDVIMELSSPLDHKQAAYNYLKGKTLYICAESNLLTAINEKIALDSSLYLTSRT